MTASRSTSQNVSAGRFPLVHKLVTFAALRRYYREMREALKASNRQAGAYKGRCTRLKRECEDLERKTKRLEIEIVQHLTDKHKLGNQVREISEKFQSIGTTLAKLEALEAAIDDLSKMKSVADEEQQAKGYWTTNAIKDLIRAVDSFLETVDKILLEDLNRDDSDSHGRKQLSPL